MARMKVVEKCIMGIVEGQYTNNTVINSSGGVFSNVLMKCSAWSILICGDFSKGNFRNCLS